MLTTRGFWFFLTVFTALAAATITGAVQLMLVSLTLFFWFLAQWFLFQLRIRLLQRRLHVTRTLNTTRGKVDSIWTRQNVEVVISVTNAGFLHLPYVLLLDRLPDLAQLKDGSLRQDGSLSTEQPLTMTYRIECKSPGRLRFEGVKVQLSDLQGFFTYMTFLRDPREYRVLPALAVEPSHTTFVKQHNVLPLLGTHRHPRPGTSSELLDLRDYLPGDPPKLIAWKISARRDRLITREFESEVPIRCTLFLDMSNSVRIGPAGETALGRLVEIAAGIAQANASERDLTGLCLFDESAVQETIKPGRGAKHLWQMLDLLTHAASMVPHTPNARLRDLLPFAYGLVQDVYPDWLDRDVNHFPFWLPLWSPQPSYTIKHGRRRWRFSPTHHGEYRWRKQVAAILSVRYGLAPGGLGVLLEDDELCAEYIQRFLVEHQVAYPYPLYDDDGRYLFAAPEKAQVLAQAILHAVTHGKDNELFVLCVDLLELSDIAPLERAICVARARHHQVVAICPWPAAVLVPGSKASTEPSSEPLHALDLHRILLRLSTTRLHQAFAKLQRALGRLSVPVICAAQGDTVAWILHRMRRLRVQERGVR